MAEKEPDAATPFQKIATVFDQYIQPAYEVGEIRKHLFPADATDDMVNHQPLDANLKVEYLEAVRTNVAARRRYMEAVALAVPEAPHPDLPSRLATDQRDFLDQHLELSRLRKQSAQLTALNGEVNAILSSSDLPMVPRGSTTVNPEAATVSSENGQQQDLPRSIMQSIQALEMALVYARHEATQQKVLLDQAKSSMSEPGNASDERRLAALSVARKILTIWLQESLDKCQEGPDVWDDQVVDDARQTDEDVEAQIEMEYEQYLEARRQLLSVTAKLRALLPDKEKPRKIEDNKQVEQSFVSQATDLVNAIERRLLSSMQQQRMSSSHVALVDEQIHKESTATINMLDRLSDESQLLQAFPLLAGSGRFVHATSIFGDKQKHDANVGTKDEVSKRLGPWMFAAEAADVASSGAIEKHLKQGREAMDEARRGLAAIQLKEARI
ncbi:hypothetical protein AYL99_10548 [Fonsecaea erecta]|uniref:Uncharacterized protein n=1 Tax=Fonsecaea erecta TaxID=1367422 RepID=A0A178Z970_9EURO|nr:hypothetical protein AYL99_10548 [Fonsecaea erecta]OAP55575.1 hypothetical protein AYL99_10548 [Fonsecaea erecta]